MPAISHRGGMDPEIYDAFIAQLHRYVRDRLIPAEAQVIEDDAVPEAILAKPGSLDPQEWAAIRRHPLDGARILGVASDPLHALAAEVALNHHEKWDGSGYPAGREGSNIPLSGRIVAVADFVDALGTRASYRDALDEGAIFALLDLAAGMQFDPAVVAAMHRIRPQLPQLRKRAALHAARAGAGSPPPHWWRTLAALS